MKIISYQQRYKFKHTFFSKMFNRATSFLALLLILFSSCGNDDNPDSNQLENEPAIRSILSAEIIMHDVEGLVLNSLFIVKNQDPRGNANTHTPSEFNFFTGFGSCASLDLDTDNNVLVIDFGAGCEDQFGITRSGQISMSYLSSFNNLQNEIDISFNNYQYQETSVAGSIEIIKVLEESSTYIDGYESAFTDLIITNLSTQLTLSGTRTFALQDNTADAVSTQDRRAILSINNNLSGSANDLPFSSINNQSITNTSDCWHESVIFPTSGAMRITLDNSDYNIDFSRSANNLSNSCDYELAVVDPSENEFYISLRE